MRQTIVAGRLVIPALLTAALLACNDQGSTAPRTNISASSARLSGSGGLTITQFQLCKKGSSATFDVSVALHTGGTSTSTVSLNDGDCVVLWTNDAPRDNVTVTEQSQSGVVLDSIVRIRGFQNVSGGPIVADTTVSAGPSVSGFAGHEFGTVATFYNRILPPPPPPCQVSSSISSNFNGTAIAAGRTIWFNSIVNVQGRGSSQASVQLTGSTITFGSYTLVVPDAEIDFSASASSATTAFSGGKWVTTVPVGYSGNVFLSGLGWVVPSGGLPGGVNPVTWAGTFSASQTGLSFQWKWGAAVYTSFSSNNNAIGVKPIDGSQLNPYANSDHAGTPENFKAFVTGGARGGGGSNWTGSYSGTATAACP